MASMPIQEQEETLYLESDGKPTAYNTEQFDWIVTIKRGAFESLVLTYKYFRLGLKLFCLI